MSGIESRDVESAAREDHARTKPGIVGGSSPPVGYRTIRGIMFRSKVEEFLDSPMGHQHLGKVQLIFTSPPFPLNRKKKYGNMTGDAYVEWFASFAMPLRCLLKDSGSIVIELGNAWEPGKPLMSTVALRALLAFLDAGKLKLCQQFICYNPARLPSPAEWVNVRRIRVKDAYTHVWWMAPSEQPEADNRRILSPYSPAMLDLLRRKKYTSGKRPSHHNIGTQSFFTDNGGAIPSNVLTIANTSNHGPYYQYCRDNGLPPHPARMPIDLPNFFIKFLSRPRQLVLDPFAGSNTTGAAAERLTRRWVSIEPNPDYIRGSLGRFDGFQIREQNG